MDSWSRETGVLYRTLSQGSAPVGGPFPSSFPGGGNAWFILLGVDLIAILAFNSDQANVSAFVRGQRIMAAHYKATTDAQQFWTPWRGELVMDELDDFEPRMDNGSPLAELTWAAWGVSIPK